MPATVTTTAVVGRGLHPGECGGDGCDARNPWPLHNVRHRGVFCRLCTSCVLRYHHGSFCSTCFDVLEGAAATACGGDTSPADRPVVQCSKCPSVSHLACLSAPELAAQFVCPSCKNLDGFSYFPVSTREETASEGERPSDGSRNTIDSSNAKALLAAAQFAAASMSRAAAAARAEAERKVKEAVMARKRAREMLETACVVSKREKEKEVKVELGTALVSKPEEVEPKKKMLQPSRTVAAVLAAQKRIQNREREKLRKFHDPLTVRQRPAQGIAEKDKSHETSMSGPKNVSGNVKNGLGSSSKPTDHVVHEKGKKGMLSGPERGSTDEENRNLTKNAAKGTRGAQ
ncbi:uncharacterized protein LOC120103982 [Phoenix dactylifera]|uniref:Uncharacterized protein LOC103707684 n=1 Tax=Phoenix dactylifera TaxID=42345 RepID=A0A8B8ZUA4_PHODC|nr:uncharacterized protein LOC103707684 [Phoenix dactylifera]XP_038975118.1 uncharacterized protein LOC120103982 [Phoenix dactylifera]